MLLKAKPLKERTYFYIKISYRNKNHMHMAKNSRIRRLNMGIYLKTL